MLEINRLLVQRVFGDFDLSRTLHIASNGLMLEKLVSKLSSTHPPHSSIRACARALEGVVQREGRLVYNSSVWNAFTSLQPGHQGELDGSLAQV